MQEMSTLTIKGKTYEVVDKKAREAIKEILAILADGGTTTKYYTVTANLTNAEVSPMPSLIAEGEAYAATITIPDDYEMTECSVKMGNTNIPVTAYEFNIEAVTDNITITITAVKTNTGGDTGEGTTHTITINKSNIDIVENKATEVNHEDSYQNMLYAKDGYEITTFEVTMGGAVVANMDNVQGDQAQFTIDSVTGNIVITAIATAIDSGGGGTGDTESAKVYIGGAPEVTVYHNGQIFVSGSNVSYDENNEMLLQIEVNDGYQINYVDVTLADGTNLTDAYNAETQTVTLTNIAQRVTITILTTEIT